MSELRVECGHRPQDWSYVGTARVALLVELPEGDELAARCAEAARTGDLDDVLDALLRAGWHALPDFAAVDRQTLRVLARGTASADAQGPGPSGRIRNTGRQPWIDIEIDPSVQVVVLDGDTDAPPAPAAAPRAAADSAAGDPHQRARHEALTETWGAVGGAAAANPPSGAQPGPATPPPPLQAGPGPGPAAPSPFEPAPPRPAEPPAPGQPGPDEPAPPRPAEPPAPGQPGPDEPAPPRPADPGAQGAPAPSNHEAALAADPELPDGTAAAEAGSLEAPAEQPPEPADPSEEAAASPTPPASAPVVMAIRCSEGHPNAPHARRCRLCGKDVPPQAPAPMHRPALGVLIASTGDRVTLDRDVIVGRSPRVPDDVPEENRPHLLRVASPANDVSRNHVRVHLDGWQVKVSDLGSTNGTVLTWPESEPIQLRPEAPRVIEPGTRVSLAADISITYQLTP